MNIGDRVFIIDDIDFTYYEVSQKLINPSMTFRDDLELDKIMTNMS